MPVWAYTAHSFSWQDRAQWIFHLHNLGCSRGFAELSKSSLSAGINARRPKEEEAELGSVGLMIYEGTPGWEWMRRGEAGVCGILLTTYKSSNMYSNERSYSKIHFLLWRIRRLASITWWGLRNCGDCSCLWSAGVEWTQNWICKNRGLEITCSFSWLSTASHAWQPVAWEALPSFHPEAPETPSLRKPSREKPIKGPCLPQVLLRSLDGHIKPSLLLVSVAFSSVSDSCKVTSCRWNPR